MAAGPRLDRPSAIGDEGRARAASLGIASVVLAGTLLAVVYFAGLRRPFRTTMLGAGLVVGGVGLLRRDSVSALAFGHLMFLPGGVVLLAGIAMSMLSGGPVLANFLFAFGTAVAAIGLGGSWANVDYGATVTAAKQGWAAALVPIVGGVLLAFVGGVGWLVYRLLVDPRTLGTPSISGLFLLLALVALAVRIALGSLPITALAAQERKAEIERRRQRWRTVAVRGAVVCGALWGVLGLLEVSGTAASLPGYRLGGRLLGSLLVRVPVFLLGALTLLSVVVVWVVRRVTRDRDDGLTLIGPVIGALSLLLVPGPVLFLLARGITESGAAGTRLSVFVLLIAILLATVAVVFLFAFSLGPVAVSLGLLPDRAGAIALASAGALVAAIGIALMPVHPALAYAAVGAAMVVWDTSEFGLGLTVELGHIPDTRRLELVHGVAGLGIGVVGVALATGLDAAFRAVAPSDPILSAMVLAVGGVLLLLVPLRG